jgi:hypothetical protein
MGEAKLLTIIKTNLEYKLRIYVGCEVFLYNRGGEREMAIKNRPVGGGMRQNHSEVEVEVGGLRRL